MSKDPYQDLDNTDLDNDLDNIDDLAKSLQQQIQNFDHIPELEADDQDEQPAQAETPEPSGEYHYDDLLTEQIESDQSNDLQHQLKQQLEEQESQVPVAAAPWFSFQWLILGLSGIFILFGIATFWLLGDDPEQSQLSSEPLQLPDIEQTEISDTPVTAVELAGAQTSSQGNGLTPEWAATETSIEVENNEFLSEQQLQDTGAIAQNTQPQSGDQKHDDHKFAGIDASPQVQSQADTPKGQKIPKSLLEQSEAATALTATKKIRLFYEGQEERQKDNRVLSPTPKTAAVKNTAKQSAMETVDLIQAADSQPVRINFEHSDEKSATTSEQKQTPVPRVTKILPSPVIGKKQRQWLDIQGQNFDKNIRLVLRWTGGKQGRKKFSKTFSASRTPDQFQRVNSDHIRLFINTGVEDSIWQLQLLSGDQKSDYYQFRVVPPFSVVDKKQSTVDKEPARVTEKTKIKPRNKTHAGKSGGRSHDFIQQQKNNTLTIQLYSTTEFRKIEYLLKKYASYRLRWYQRKLQGKTWYSIIYGSYDSYQDARQAWQRLPSELAGKKPWIRSYKELKAIVKTQQIARNKDPSRKVITSKHQPGRNGKTLGAQDMVRAIRNTYMGKWTLQLISLATESEMKRFIQRNRLDQQARYFPRNVNGKTRYTLIYGRFDSRSQARAALKKLPLAIRRGKPWIRQYGEIQRLLK